MNRRNRKIKGPFVAVPKAIMATPAWRAMTAGGRLLWIELRGWLRNDGLNNGKMFLACRSAAVALGTGFLRKTSEGFLGSDGRGVASHYRFTDLSHGTHPPTRDFEKWEGVMFEYARRRGGPRKQNPVSPRDTPRVPQGHIRQAKRAGSVCAPQGHIGSSGKCAPQGHISRLPSLTPVCSPDQGSSTVRAPAPAGEAGSSPAPDANPGGGDRAAPTTSPTTPIGE
jgi:hypothetical protein